jgi:outer membrane protein assembly factor BamB
MKAASRAGIIAAAVATLTLWCPELGAQDWAQWHGPNRDNINRESGLNLDWATKQPSQAWVYRAAGMGYSAPTVAGGTLYCQGAENRQGFAFAIDTATGREKWRQQLGPESVADREDCPRGSVTVDGDKLYVIQGIGRVSCLSTADGRVIWQKDLVKELGGRIMSDWGYTESPLVDGDLVICSPGGSGGTMAALNKNTGAVVWRSKEWTHDAAHSSPIVVTVDGVKHYVQQSAGGVAGVRASDGKVLWKLDVPGYRTAVIPSPVFSAGTVYVTSGYNAGCNAIRLSKSGDGIAAEPVYANKNMVNQHGGVVLVGGNIYGFTDGMGMVCQNFATGEIVWRERNPQIIKGSVLAVGGDRLLVQNERNGLLAVIAASPEGWKEFGRMDFPERTKISTTDNMVWAHPVIAHGKLYVRDHDLLFCYDLKN